MSKKPITDILLFHEEKRFLEYRRTDPKGIAVNCVGKDPYMIHYASCSTFRPLYTGPHDAKIITDPGYLLRHPDMPICWFCAKRGLRRPHGE